MAEKTGYDLGGAEGPYDPDTHTVVDHLLYKYAADNWGGDVKARVEYVARDLSKPGWWEGLEPRKDVYAGRVMRYVAGPDKANFLAGVRAVVAPGGAFTVFDHPADCRLAARELGWPVTKQLELCNPGDARFDMTAEGADAFLAGGGEYEDGDYTITMTRPE